jgi:molecular chaperone DnaK (HSP70)
MIQDLLGQQPEFFRTAVDQSAIVSITDADGVITHVDVPELELVGFEVRRETLEAWLEPWVRKTTRIAKQVLRDAAVDFGDLDGVVLVGGSTRVPLVRQRVAELVGRDPLTDLDPDAVVDFILQKTPEASPDLPGA